ncbi:MAG: bifunctional 4-hydroxy-3-methylbut-2-enyl diphosphate reductase/30S ribosomal protein S1 [Halanaerobiaceae bacterium]
MKVLEIITAEEAGFCFGVQRAIDMAINAVKNNKDTPVYTLGSLIHNPQVVNKLKELGISSISSIDDVSEGILIIRSHGVEPEILKKAKQKGLHIINATCPYVKKAQNYAHNLIKEGYQTFIFGDADHPEVKGIYGFTSNEAIIVKNPEKLQEIKIKNKVGFVAQTTQSPSSYKDIIASLINRVNEMKVFNTICNTTQIRQQAATELAKKVDIMFVIGGYNSANTNRLAELCQETGTPTYHIETIEDLNWNWLQKKDKIGITAGASTPDWLIKEVIQAMSEKEQEKNIEEENKQVEDVENLEEEEVEKEVNEEVKTEENEEMENKELENENEEIETEEMETVEYSDNDIANLKKGQIVEGTVVEVSEDGVYVDVNYKTEGFIPLHELSHSSFDNPEEVVETGDDLKVVVLTLEDDEGNLILSKKQADYEKAWEDIMEAYENDEVIEAEITKEVKGGLVVDVGVRGFVPASHVAIGYVEDLSDYIGKTLPLKVIEVERENNNVVLSAKKVLEEQRESEKNETMNNLEEGQTIAGTITKLVDFGAFVDIGGIEGLLHISEMSWGRIEHPSDMFEEGQEIEVKVLSIDHDNERISLGYKQLQPDPWEQFAEKHYEGEVIEGTITKTVDFGAFMEIEQGIEGLIHISQLSQEHVKTPDEVVSVGETREAKILNIDPEQKRVGLSLKELEDQKQTSSKSSNKEETNKKEESSNNNNKSQEENKEENTEDGATIGELVGDIFDES